MAGFYTEYVTNLIKILLRSSHAVIGGAAASLGAHPVDVLAHVLDVAGLAVDAVGGVDDQLVHPRVVWLILVHTGGAEPALWPTVLGKVEIFRNIVIHQGQMSGLVSFVIGT